MKLYNIDAEKSVLGAMLQSQVAVDIALETLTPESFYSSANAEIFDAMRALKPIDIVTLEGELTKRGRIENVGGLPYLLDVKRFVPSAVNIKAYVQIVQEKHTLRRLLDMAENIEMRVRSDETEDVEAMVETAEKQIFELATKKGGGAFEPIQPLVISAYEKIENIVLNKGKLDGVPTGYTELDEALTGLHGGELIIIAARPSMGKTAFGMNIACNASIRAGKKVAIFSLEMPSQQIVLRMLASEARVNMQGIRRGDLSDDEWERLALAMEVIGNANLFVDDASGITVQEMRSKVRKLKAEHGLDLILVDYLQLIAASGKHGNRQEEVTQISQQLKALAKELRVPVIALSQLSRSNANRTDKRPVLSDIRDSGSIEQDADVVMFVHRDDYYDKDTANRNIAEIIIAKQRNGALGTVKLGWRGECTQFLDISQRRQA